MLVTAPAREHDAVHRGMRGPRQALDLPEGREPNSRGPGRRAVEPVGTGESVDAAHGHGVAAPSDGSLPAGPLVGDQRVNVGALEPLAAVEKGELDDEQRTDALPAETLDELDLGPGRATRREHVVEHD